MDRWRQGWVRRGKEGRALIRGDGRSPSVFFLAVVFLGLFFGCVQLTEPPETVPRRKPIIEKCVPVPEPIIPMPFWPERPVTPQSDRSRSVRERQTPALAKAFHGAGLALGSPVFIRIFKESRELELWVARDEIFVHFKTYPIACFSGTLGPKKQEGDRQAPEGFYCVPPSRMNPNSQFHLSFDIGYPNDYDRTHRRTGSALMVHGSWVSSGCFAMTDPGIEEIYTIVDYALNAGQPFIRVHIFPFRMSEENMRRHAASSHIKFWRNLREGYDYFEILGRPPEVGVWNQRYIFASCGK